MESPPARAQDRVEDNGYLQRIAKMGLVGMRVILFFEFPRVVCRGDVCSNKN